MWHTMASPSKAKGADGINQKGYGNRCGDALLRVPWKRQLQWDFNRAIESAGGTTGEHAGHRKSDQQRGGASLDVAGERWNARNAGMAVTLLRASCLESWPHELRSLHVCLLFRWTLCPCSDGTCPLAESRGLNESLGTMKALTGPGKLLFTIYAFYPSLGTDWHFNQAF